MKRMRNTPRWRFTSVAAAVMASATALVLSACGPTYTYLTSTKSESYLAVPHSWKVFSQNSIMSSTGSNGTGSFAYLAFFDDNSQPSLKDSLAATSKPWGVLRIRDLSGSEQASYSFDSLGNELIQLDQMTQSGQAQVVGNTTVLTHGNYRGIRQEVAIAVGGKTLLADEEGYVNSGTTKAWALLVGCSASCFNQNHAEINRLVQSWTVGKS
jgi:hypothetical protein